MSSVSKVSRPYSAPKLVRYGDMAKLTASGTASGTESGGNGKKL